MFTKKLNSHPFLLLKQTLTFLAVFILLQLLWSLLRLTGFGLWLIEGATVQTTVWLINLLTPHVHALAQNTHIIANGGGINVLNGCEGVEVMFILIAAMAVAPLAWRFKLAGMAVGVMYVFLVNQIRLVAMFYAVRTDKQLFETVHGLIGPILLVAITGLFFAYWLSKFAVSTRFALSASEVKDDQATLMATSAQAVASNQSQSNLVFPPR